MPCERKRDDGGLEIGEEAAHRHVAQFLVLIGRRRRQNSDREHVLDRAALDRPQQHFGVRRAADDQRRNRIGAFDLLLGAGKPEQAIGDARTAQEEHLQEPIKRDRDLAEKERAEQRRIKQDVIEHEQRNRQHRHRAENVAQIRQRGEAPLRHVEVEIPVHYSGIDDVAGQNDRGASDSGPPARHSRRSQSEYRASPASPAP